MSAAAAPPVPASAPDREQMNIVIVGHVDHGKSTLVGRLLADSDSLPVGKLEYVQGICRRQGKIFEYAFLLDALEAEQDQGITIDSARCFFKTDLRDYIIIDAPGHIEFLKNMISGAARAEAALLLIDAKEGVRENSRRHGYLLSMLGIRQVTVCVNKMDLVDYSQQVFDAIEEEYREFLAGIGVVPRRFIPMSAREGDNIALPMDKMPWYRGPTVLEAVDTFAQAPAKHEQPLRIPVQDVYKWNERGDDRRIIAGRMEAGRLRVGDRVVFSPSSKTSTVASIEQFSAPTASSIEAPRCVGFTLNEQLFVERGEIVSHSQRRPTVSTRFRANIFWLGREPMVKGKMYKLKLGTKAVGCQIHELVKVFDASQLESNLHKTEVGRHDVAEMVIEAKRPVAFDLTHEHEATARFVIVDGYEICGGGIILDSVGDAYTELRKTAQRRDFEWVAGEVAIADRMQRNQHRAVLVLLTGAAGVGKHAVARALEKRLFVGGRQTYMLDARNVFLGLDQDLVGRMDRNEMVRRYGEVAHLFLDAGNIVISTSNTFGLADHGTIATLVSPSPVVTIHVGEAFYEADIRVDTDPDIDRTVDGILEHLDAGEYLRFP